jgi:hypothetical protein
MEQILESIGVKRVPENNAETAEHIFKLPITYLPKDKVHELKPHVVADLELDTTIYPILLENTTGFMQDIIPEMHRHYTTDEEYLKDTQQLLRNDYVAPSAPLDEPKLREIYKALYKDPRFLEKHNYMEWSILEYMNHSSIYLQIIAATQLISPALSLIMPLFFIVVPVLILLLSGVQFTMTSYFNCLKSLAQNHFIGKMLSTKSTGYLITMILLYAFQIYQNCLSCRRFYVMIHTVNANLCDLRAFLQTAVTKMDTVINHLSQLPSYQPFSVEVRKHRTRIQALLDGVLSNISPIQMFMTKLPLMGQILHIYYTIHSSDELSESIRYVFGFEGWYSCVSNIACRIHQGKIGMAEILGGDSATPQITDQYYPPLMDSPECVKNNCIMDTNVILTGINASGKTTYLKTTLLNVILTQQWGCGFYKSCAIQPFHQIHSYLNIPDTSARDSLFQAESRRCKEILDSIVLGGRHFCIFDELYSGTNPDEASKSAYGFLRYLAKRENVRFMLTTHYIGVCKRLEEEECDGIQYLQMDVEEEGDEYVYKHCLKDGICEIQGGVQVLRKMEYPEELLGYIM